MWMIRQSILTFLHLLSPSCSPTKPVIMLVWTEVWRDFRQYESISNSFCSYVLKCINWNLIKCKLILSWCHFFVLKTSHIIGSALPSVTSACLWLRDFMLSEVTGNIQPSSSGSLLYGTFWTVWERSTLLSRAVKQLTQLLVKAAIEVNT